MVENRFQNLWNPDLACILPTYGLNGSKVWAGWRDRHQGR